MNRFYLLIGLALALASIAIGQTQKPRKAASDGEAAAESRKIALMSDMRIDAQLQGTLDANNARIGDRVVFKTTGAIKQGGTVIAEKGSKLFGRITDVQRRTKDNAMSRIGMVFERIEGKDFSLPISASVVSITNAAAQVTAGDLWSSDMSGSSQTTTSTRSSSDGLLGGVTGTAGGLVNTATQTVGTLGGTVAQTAGTTTGVVGRTVNGIQISTVASGSANSSTTLLSANRNVRIEKGATFNLRVDNQQSTPE